MIKQHMSRTSLQHWNSIQANKIELTIFWMWQEQNVIFCIFWTLNFTNWRQWIVRLTLWIFFTNAPIVVWIPMKARSAVELLRLTIVAHIISLTVFLLWQKDNIIWIILSGTRVQVQQTIRVITTHATQLWSWKVKSRTASTLNWHAIKTHPIARARHWINNFWYAIWWTRDWLIWWWNCGCWWLLGRLNCRRRSSRWWLSDRRKFTVSCPHYWAFLKIKVEPYKRFRPTSLQCVHEIEACPVLFTVVEFIGLTKSYLKLVGGNSPIKSAGKVSALQSLRAWWQMVTALCGW